MDNNEVKVVTKESVKQWVSEHKKQIIIGSIAVTGTVAAVVLLKNRRKVVDKFEKFSDHVVGPALNMANDSTFRSECGIPDGDILFQNIVSRNIPGFETEKIIPVAHELPEITQAFGDYLTKLIDNIGIENIEDITVCYDIAKHVS